MAQLPPLTQLSDIPSFNTKAVVRETGVPADTFRAWERRYNLPQPQRTASGHRLYSERDIAIIRWLRERTAEGINIRHAVRLLNNALVVALSHADEHQARSLDQLETNLIQALRLFDAQQADQLLGEAFSLYPFEQVLLECIQPAMIAIGELWHQGALDITTEHFATQFIRRKLASFANVFDSTSYRASIIFGCAPSEQHDLGALIGMLFLLRRGWRVIYLGPQVPLDDLLTSVSGIAPALICLSASTLETAHELHHVAQHVLAAFPQVYFGYGGRSFNLNPELCATMPGIFLGRNAYELAENVEQLLT